MKLKSLITAALLGTTLSLSSITADAATKDKVKPQITGATTKTVYIGQTFNPLKGVKAYDKVDGNITKKVKVTGKYNIKKAGTYTLTYTVKDRAKNKRIVKRKIIVKKDNVAPKISGIKTISIPLGGTVNLRKGITAKDNISGNLTKKVKISGTYNTKIAKTYTLTYSVKDSAGNTKKVKRKLIVKPLNVTLKQKSQYFKAKGGYGTLTTAPAKSKLKIAQRASKKWMKTTSGKWVRDGFIGNYVYLDKQTTVYDKAKGKKSGTLNGGIYPVSKTTENGWIQVSKGWIKSGEFVDNYIDYGNKEKQQEIIKTVNKERAKVGRPALKENPMLTKIAIIKSMDMAKNHYFSHYSPVYGSFDTILRQANYKYYYAGENIAAGQRSAADFMNSWMSSTGHRANILNETFTEIGVGVVENIPNAQMPTYGTQEFGRPF